MKDVRRMGEGWMKDRFRMDERWIENELGIENE